MRSAHLYRAICRYTGLMYLKKIYRPDGRPVRHRDGSGSGSVRVFAGFGFSGFGFGVGFSPTVFRFGFGLGFGFWFPPVDIQWISEINHLELILMFYNMLMITCLLSLLKVDS